MSYIYYDPLGGLFLFMAAYWWLWIVSSIVVGGVTAVIALTAPRLVGPEPRSLAHLRTSMALTAIAIILAGFGIFVGTAWLIGYLMGYPIGGAGIVMAAVILTVILILFQWLLSPLFINLVYRARPPRTPEEKRYEEMLKEVARSSGIKPPKLRIAEVDVPNAFCYGSPLSGSYVAVTRGLLNLMPDEEVKAVLGHEVGHLRHRDVSWLLALSVIPLAVYYLGQMLVWSGFFGGAYEERRGGANGGVILMLIGAVLMAAGVVFRFLVGNFNRLREYYADANAAMVTSPRSIQRALARLYVAMKGERYLAHQVNSTSSSMLKMLFIVAPLVEIHGGFLYEPSHRWGPWRRSPDLGRYRSIDIDSIVESVKREKTSATEEVFATHPPIPKRLRFIDNLRYSLGLA